MNETTLENYRQAIDLLNKQDGYCSLMFEYEKTINTPKQTWTAYHEDSGVVGPHSTPLEAVEELVKMMCD